MPVTQSDIKFYKTSHGKSLGGGVGNEIVGDILNNLWDDVEPEEAEIGDTEYRCFLVKNNNPTDTWRNVKVWLMSDESPSGVSIDLGLDGRPPFIFGTTQSVTGDEDTPPQPAVTFVSFGKGSSTMPQNALVIGDMGPGTYKGIWIRRTVSSNTPSKPSNTFAIRFRGETA